MARPKPPPPPPPPPPPKAAADHGQVGHRAAEAAVSACVLCVCCPLAVVWCCLVLPLKVGYRAARRLIGSRSCCCGPDRRLVRASSSFSDIEFDGGRVVGGGGVGKEGRRVRWVCGGERRRGVVRASYRDRIGNRAIGVRGVEWERGHGWWDGFCCKPL
ncbi:hypothetical protein QJS04_geneDACA003106 [Acorus gramineus]|uniref:Uncharacterized protein n=1 Tax=Acorus gramineus TaxID=55184 RepID=A0AAV9BXM5_ACOGR|nr:hypothetical protein QJS04_geneDACA003106 [Acorus gramineus]